MASHGSSSNLILKYKSAHDYQTSRVRMSSPLAGDGSSKRRLVHVRCSRSEAAPRPCRIGSNNGGKEVHVAPKKSVRFNSQSANNSSDDDRDIDNEVTTFYNVDKSQIWYSEEEIVAMKSTARQASLHFRSRDDHRRANRQSIVDEFEEQLPSVLSALDSTATEREMLIMKAMLARQMRRDKKEMDESSSPLPVEDVSNTDTSMCRNTCNSTAPTTSSRRPCIPRGLEQRVSFRRQWKKFQAVRCVLECQRVLREEEQLQEKPAERAHVVSVHAGQKRSFDECKYSEMADPNFTKDITETTPENLSNQEEEDTPTKLARASSKCSQWARDIALATGQTDMLEVYPEMASFVFSRRAQTTPSPPPQVVPDNAPNNKHKHTCTYANTKKECVVQPNLTRDTSAQASIVSLGEDDDAATAGSATATTKDSPIDLELEDITATTVNPSQTTEPEDYNNAADNNSNSNDGAHTTNAANEMTDFLNSSYCALFSSS